MDIMGLLQVKINTRKRIIKVQYLKVKVWYQKIKIKCKEDIVLDLHLVLLAFRLFWKIRMYPHYSLKPLKKM